MRHTLIASVLLLTGCTCDSDPYAGTLSDNVGESFAACNDAEIRFLAAKHNVQLAFAPCGSNNFSAFRWSPDGLRIYFQLVLSANVMDADAADKRTIQLPIPAPSGPAVWLSTTRLAVPLVADDQGEDLRLALLEVPAPGGTDEGAPPVAGQLAIYPLRGVRHVDAVQPGDTLGDVLIAGRATTDGPREVWRLTTDDSALAKAFPWREGPFTTFTYTPSLSRAAFGHDDQVWLVDANTGEELHRWEHARRGTLHPKGRWMMLEFDGAPVSAFDQRVWGEVSDEARKREEARAQAFAERLPDALEREVRPPTLSVADLERSERWTFTAFLGDGFQWYPAASEWGSFFFWGFEGKQYKRNVALVDLGALLRAVDEDRERLGLERFSPPTP